jgi:GT2 family glycosyltransferase
MALPTCDIVIPTYNRARLLPECVASVLDSGLPFGTIFVVDDGSTDDTAEVARRLGPDVTYLRQRQLGLSAARNAGVARSTAKYVLLLDDDDRLLPGAGTRMLAFAGKHAEVAAVFADVLRGSSVHDESSYHARWDFRYLEHYPASRHADGFRIFHPPHLAHTFTLGMTCFVPSSTILRRDALAAVGGFDEELRCGEDHDMWIRLLEKFPVGYFAHPAARWIMTPGSLSVHLANMRASELQTLQKLVGGNYGTGLRRTAAMRLIACAFENGAYTEVRRWLGDFMRLGGQPTWALLYGVASLLQIRWAHPGMRTVCYLLEWLSGSRPWRTLCREGSWFYRCCAMVERRSGRAGL